MFPYYLAVNSHKLQITETQIEHFYIHPTTLQQMYNHANIFHLKVFPFMQ